MTEVAALVLAAGSASRYRKAGGREATKLIADYHGEPLVRWAARAALASRARPVLVVTGHARAEVEQALAGFDVVFAHNPDFAEGLASSLKTGVAAAPANADGVVVLLGDMPDISPELVDALIVGFGAAPGALAAAAMRGARRGNPVLLGRGLFPQVALLKGDEGARGLLDRLAPGQLASVAADDPSVIRDVDTPADLASDFVVRDAQPRDRASIVVAIAELQDYERTLSDTRLPGAEVAPAYFERLWRASRDEGAMLVAETAGEFVGFAAGWVELDDEICETPDSNRYGYVSDICVRAGFRGRRAAGALLGALEQRLAATGVTRLRLNFLAGNASARAAYERVGYAPYELRYEKRVGPRNV